MVAFLQTDIKFGDCNPPQSDASPYASGILLIKG